ncbi:MAG: tRNA preQ1(34) S-adenosylmethionine ribosyltransferase-isomerase QueA [bacterium]
MDISLFDYNLPQELIAQFPSRERDQSQLMIIDRNSKNSYEKIDSFNKVAEFIKPGDALVVNDTKVFKARLFGFRKTGANIEIFLIRRVNETNKLQWYAFVSPSRRVKTGEYILFENDSVELLEDLGNGKWIVSFKSKEQLESIINNCGHIPLPHYIRRDDQPEDLQRYQTIFAGDDKTGAVAAPTAGFHFTKRLLAKFRENGIKVLKITLHVGPGTFKPVKVDDIESHSVDPEFAEITPEVAVELNNIRSKGGSIFAVGTTSVRTLESAEIINNKIQPFSDMVDLYIKPGYKFNVVDHLITNFHLPKSSLIILVSAFAGRERIIDAYQAAIENKMRFYSYGDAMLIL